MVRGVKVKAQVGATQGSKGGVAVGMTEIGEAQVFDQTC